MHDVYLVMIWSISGIVYLNILKVAQSKNKLEGSIQPTDSQDCCFWWEYILSMNYH